MSIDTRNKRASVVGLALSWACFAPVPDGSLNSAADREQVAHCYSGIATTPVVYAKQPTSFPLDTAGSTGFTLTTPGQTALTITSDGQTALTLTTSGATSLTITSDGQTALTLTTPGATAFVLTTPGATSFVLD